MIIAAAENCFRATSLSLQPREQKEEFDRLVLANRDVMNHSNHQVQSPVVMDRHSTPILREGQGEIIIEELYNT